MAQKSYQQIKFGSDIYKRTYKHLHTLLTLSLPNSKLRDLCWNTIGKLRLVRIKLFLLVWAILSSYFLCLLSYLWLDQALFFTGFLFDLVQHNTRVPFLLLPSWRVHYYFDAALFINSHDLVVLLQPYLPVCLFLLIVRIWDRICSTQSWLWRKFGKELDH